MYSTIQSICSSISKDILLQLLNDEGRDTDNIDLSDESDIITQRANEIINNVGDWINSFLRGRYKLPLSNIPDVIKQISDDAVIYHCYKRRHRLDMPDSLADLYGKLIKDLERIQKGTMILPIAGNEIKPTDTIIVNKTEADRLFNKEMLNRF